jgi:ankyrin repeat protein
MSIPPIIQAILNNNVDKVASLIEKQKRKNNSAAFPGELNMMVIPYKGNNATFSYKDPRYIFRNNYPLHIAARLGYIEIIRLLVNQGAPIDEYDGNGQTPLIAALADNRSMTRNSVTTLLGLGCSLQVDKNNMTPLHWATQSGLEFVVELLIEKDKTSMYIVDKYGGTPVDIAVGGDKKRIINVYYQTDPDIVSTNGDLLHYTVWQKRDEMMKHLFWLGVPIYYLEKKNAYGHTPLQLALSDPIDRMKVIILLLDLGADADSDIRHKYGSHTEDEVAAIRYDCFFSRSLTSRLLPFCMKS